jgi:tRNA-splicing ligase RtcB
VCEAKGQGHVQLESVKQDLEKKGLRVLSAGADEVPGVYKDRTTSRSPTCFSSIASR